MIIVIATVFSSPGRRADLLSEFNKVVPLVRQEAGCLEYGPAVDVETSLSAQLEPHPDRFVVCEKWESLEDLEAHLIAPHMLEYRARAKGLVDRVEIQVLQPV